MRIHRLKTYHEYFVAQTLGIKQFEVRYNDRNYQVGDVLILREWNNDNGYIGVAIYLRVIYVLEEFEGLKDGYVVLGTEPLTKEEIEEVVKSGY